MPDKRPPTATQKDAFCRAKGYLLLRKERPETAQATAKRMNNVGIQRITYAHVFTHFSVRKILFS